MKNFRDEAEKIFMETTDGLWKKAEWDQIKCPQYKQQSGSSSLGFYGDVCFQGLHVQISRVSERDVFPLLLNPRKHSMKTCFEVKL